MKIEQVEEIRTFRTKDQGGEEKLWRENSWDIEWEERIGKNVATVWKVDGGQTLDGERGGSIRL